MLEKPLIQDEIIITHVQTAYGFHITQLQFLPIGADLRTAVYRVITDDGISYFLKLRKKFKEVIIHVPVFLYTAGIQEILVPFKTNSHQRWADFGEYKIILYQFIEGKDGFEAELTDQQRRSLGAAFKRIHTTQVPNDLEGSIRKEAFSSEWREDMKSYQAQVENKIFDDPWAAKLAEFMKTKQTEITRIIDSGEQLASDLKSKPWELVLCHSDFHGGNILISNSGELYITDWDDPILAPKERDLMFVGGGVDDLWNSKRDQAVFYEGYGETEINLSALAYYRYERVIEDLAVICEHLLSTNKGGEDRERSYGWFTSNFEPGNTIEIADNTYNLMT